MKILDRKDNIKLLIGFTIGTTFIVLSGHLSTRNPHTAALLFFIGLFLELIVLSKRMEQVRELQQHREMSLYSSSIKLKSDEMIILRKFELAENEKLVVTGGGASKEDGEGRDHLEAELFDCTNKKTRFVVDKSYMGGYNLYEIEGPKKLEIRLVNATGSTKVVTGGMDFRVEPKK